MRGTEGAKSEAIVSCGGEASAGALVDGLAVGAGFGVAGRESDWPPRRFAPLGELAAAVAGEEDVAQVEGDLPELWLTPRNSIDTELLLGVGLAQGTAATEATAGDLEEEEAVDNANSVSFGGPQQHRSACDFFNIHVRSH